MATLSLSWTVPDAQATAIKDDFAAYHGWKSEINGEPNPETQNAFIKRKIGEFVKDSIRAYRANTQADAARTSSIADTESNVTLT